MRRIGFISIIFIVVFGCKGHQQKEVGEYYVKIAFLSDVHFLDIYGEFSDNAYRGVLNPATGKYTLARTMQSQLESTRLFNENYFAFKAALDDVVNRNIKYVVLPGDFSDDGQAVNIRGLKNILNEYSQKYHIHFILTTGNHDPVRPFYQDAGKIDFLGKGGKPQAIFSKKGMFASKDTDALPTVITKDIARLGYQGILQELKSFGFKPNENTVYWETPFTKYSYNDYSYQEAIKSSDVGSRTYKIKPTQAEVPDLSYLIEPGENLWFLAIDGNVYIPKGEEISYKPEDFEGASIGYNHVLTHKKYLLDWIQSVTERAKEMNKRLVVFSHFPTIDFNDDATTEIRTLFGEHNMQMHRVPNEQVAKVFANAGVKVHFGGHMHINDTGVRNFKNGRSLINIQIPSLAAYIPGYKLLTIQENNRFNIETIVLDTVPNFKTLFPLYMQEHQYLTENKRHNIWDAKVLNVSTYKDFTAWHLKELVRLRFLKDDWQEDFKNTLIDATGKDLIELAERKNGDLKTFYGELSLQNMSVSDFSKWTGLDMIYDFYKIKNADKLAIKDIGTTRLKQYMILSKLLKSTSHGELKLWGTIFIKSCNGQPANHFQIDLKSGAITPKNPLY